MAFMAVGGLVGGAVGAWTGGTVFCMAALQGAMIGMSLGAMLDTASPGATDAGKPDIQDLSYNTCEEGNPIPMAIGCTKVFGNIFWIGSSYSVPQYSESESGGSS